LWGFIGRYRPGVTPANPSEAGCDGRHTPFNYYRDFVAPTKKFREPTDTERVAAADLRDALSQLPLEHPAEDIQNVVYEIGRREPFLDAGEERQGCRPGVSLDWFQHALSGAARQEKGRRFGSFVRGLWSGECRDDDRRRAGKVGMRARYPSTRNSEATMEMAGPRNFSHGRSRLRYYTGLNRPSRRREQTTQEDFHAVQGFAENSRGLQRRGMAGAR